MTFITREHLVINSPKFEEIEKDIRKSYPKACVLWIEDIRNPKLEKKYKMQKEEIQNKRGFCNELELYHGSSEQAISFIISDGFRTSKNKTSAYGKGTYFAKKANYSKDYAKDSGDKISFMMICSVLVGECNIYSSNQTINTTKHDNSVNSINNPTIVVTPYDYGAIPRYIIAMHKNAQ